MGRDSDGVGMRVRNGTCEWGNAGWVGNGVGELEDWAMNMTYSGIYCFGVHEEAVGMERVGI